MAAKRKPRNAPDSPWYSASNEDRKRPAVKITMAPETIEGLDALAALLGKRGRGEVVDELVARALAAAREGAQKV